MKILNSDSRTIQNWEETKDGYLKLWLSIGVGNKELNYDGKIEYITPEDLVNPESINSAVGKPLVLNHPPNAVNSNNFKSLAKGVSLQEYSQDGDDVYMAAIVWDKDLKEGIKSNKYSATSSAYFAKKLTNQDGKTRQLSRYYNHFAVLSEEFTPRAGTTSKILILNNDSDDMTTDKVEEKINLDSNEVAKRTELLVKYSGVLKEKNKAIDYNLDSSQIKKAILSCFYPDEIVNQLNVDSGVLDGFWLNFIANPSSETVDKVPTGKFNFNSDSDDELEKTRKEFIQRLTTKTV